MRDLTDETPDAIAAERARVATEGWGARLLALQGDDGQWAGGAYFPGGWVAPSNHPDKVLGQPWTATLPTLQLLLNLGVDPSSEQVRRAIGKVADQCRWECDDLPFFGGEEDPCINARTVALGVYFGQDIDGIVERLLGEQLQDGGWNCWTGYGSVRSSYHSTINVLEGLLAY